MRGLVHWDPFRALRRREEPFDELFREFFRRVEPDGELAVPAVDVAESDGNVIVKAEVPGVEKDQITLQVSDDVLTLRGETRKETKEEKQNWYRREIHCGAFERVVPLPAEVDGSRATAELKNGMLTVTLPKSAQPKAQAIKVAAG